MGADEHRTDQHKLCDACRREGMVSWLGARILPVVHVSRHAFLHVAIPAC